MHKKRRLALPRHTKMAAAMDPLEDERPIIFPGVYQPNESLYRVVVAEDRDDPPPPQNIQLVRAGIDATQAYVPLPGKKSIHLDHHGRNWGFVCFAIVCPRVIITACNSKNIEEDDRDDTNNNICTFLLPRAADAECVAIKVLNKEVVHHSLQRGGQENPYREILRLQTLGDDEHVLSCVEALQDDRFLFIVTPMGERTLLEVMQFNNAVNNNNNSSAANFDYYVQVHDWFRQILKILAYLERHDICHHDLSPGNLMFLKSGRLVAYDLAMSLRIPTVNDNNRRGRRVLITPQGAFGTFPFMAPELFTNRVFDGVAVDLWSSVVILYSLLTRQVLYRVPHPSDLSFRYFILAAGLSSAPVNGLTVMALAEILSPKLQEQSQQQQHELLEKATAHLNLPPSALELFEHSLQVDPSRRWSLAQVMESDFVRWVF